MRLTTATIVAGVLVCGSIAIWWPGQTAAPLAVATLQAQQAGPPPVAKIDDPREVDAIEDNNAATRKRLSSYLSAEFGEAPFHEVLAFIAAQTEVETYANHKLMEEAGVPRDAPVTINLKRVRADMLLELALQQVGAKLVDYVVRDGIVVVTTTDSLQDALEVKAYPVADLLKLHRGRHGEDLPVAPASPLGGPGGAGGGGFGGGPASAIMPDSVDQLVNVISSTIAPESWQTSGGLGTITYYGDMLVVRQNARTHREIDNLLKLLRDTAARK